MIENVARFLKKQYGFLMFLVVSLIVSLLLFAFSDLKYVTNDDYFISTISSGVYGWEYSQYLIYSNSVLGFFIKFLNNIVKANYYMIIQYILLVISASLFATITVSKTNNYKIGFALLILMWSVIYINLFTNITFTVTAGVASIIGLLGIITYYDKNRVLTITSLVLALFGYMYRYESFLLVAPFVGLYLVFLKKKSLFSIEASKK